MERYGRTTEGSQSDPSPEWTVPGTETGLEESMWPLGLGPGESYPERSNVTDCSYYLRTGICGYGSRCRYNHPRDRSAVTGAARPGGLEYPERAGQPVCQGERECSYYVKTGQCKFGATCKFHHPQPAGIPLPVPSPAPQVSPVPAAPALYQTVQSPSVSSQQYGVVFARPPLLPGSYVQSPYGQVLLSPGTIPFPGWSPYQPPASPLPSPSTQPGVGSGTLYGMSQLSPSAAAYTGMYQPIPLPSSLGLPTTSQKEHLFPERPGQQECQYYMRTGDCKFGSSCRYHHPPEVVGPKTTVALSPSGLPSRPGAPLCTHYAQRGVCKFGPACKFDHPMGTLSYSPSASSLADMPVAPYPVGSSIGTLAPSSSSSSTELRPELNSGSGKDLVSARMSSSLSTSSGSVGSTVSKGGIAHLGVQQSAQGSGPSTSSGSSTESHSPS
ncbi:zinc finger CCCH domain-containing protein 34 [Prunus yedoensis var. nudiflora]|uniref:Zinc finger CCCH domain-containing protein 34 n=1 Tax=Prunus yedoensis var. nudiflora TaxID=2094558 RepID=A0A314UEZ7_PRUYE|nr:zinc finger CCCH domain-containing protein 34 [Prunus yedoensis var. nudiflora]